VAHLAVRRPLRESDLSDEPGLDPVGPLVGAGTGPERAGGSCQRSEECGHARKLGLAEAGSCVAHVLELPVHEQAEEQGAEVLARLPGIGPSTHHALLALLDLELAPLGAALAGVVARLERLDDESLPAFGDRPPVERSAVGGDELAQANHGGADVGEDPFQARPPRDEREVAEVLRSITDHVERDERDAVTIGGGGQRIAAMDPRLEILEARRPPRGVERHDLSIQDDRRPEPPRQVAEGPHHLGKLGGLVVPEPGPDPDAGAGTRLHGDQGADAVVLLLEDQVFAAKQSIADGSTRERGEHRAELLTNGCR
jgi:hypothetical protein